MEPCIPTQDILDNDFFSSVLQLWDVPILDSGPFDIPLVQNGSSLSNSTEVCSKSPITSSIVEEKSTVQVLSGSPSSTETVFDPSASHFHSASTTEVESFGLLSEAIPAHEIVADDSDTLSLPFQQFFFTDDGCIHAWSSGSQPSTEDPTIFSRFKNPVNCKNCQLLRKIVYSDGTAMFGLEVHATQAGFFHVLFTLENDFNGSIGTVAHLSNWGFQSFKLLKYFLADFVKAKEEKMQTVLCDITTTLYHDFCNEFAHVPDMLNNVGTTALPLSQQSSADDSPSSTSPSSTESPNSSRGKQPRVRKQKNRSTNKAVKKKIKKKTNAARSHITIQRERARKITIEELKDYMHLPIQVAAKLLKMCPTVLKKICRRHGLARWPHRKLSAIDKAIRAVEDAIEVSKNPCENVELLEEIEALKKLKIDICNGMNIKL